MQTIINTGLYTGLRQDIATLDTLLNFHFKRPFVTAAEGTVAVVGRHELAVASVS